MRRIFALAALCVSPVLAQFDTYTTSHEATLTSSSTALSLQLPATGRNQAQITDFAVQCENPCYVRPEVNGTAATANGGTILAATLTALDPETVDANPVSGKLLAFTGSGIPTGTPTAPAGGWLHPALAIVHYPGGRFMSGTGTGGTRNYIIRIMTPYTGWVKVYASVRVRRP